MLKHLIYSDVILVVEKIFNREKKNLAQFIGYSISKIAQYLGIDTKIIYSREINKNFTLKARDKIINICKNLDAKRYINAIGRQNIYDKEIFLRNEIELSFINTRINDYKQFNNEFVSNLSIIDILMFNNKNTILEYLNNFRLV